MQRVPTGTDWTVGDSRYWTREETTNSDVGLHFTVEWDGVNDIIPGVITDAVIPFDGIIYKWEILSDGIASVEFEIGKTTSENYPPSTGDSITGTAPPILTAGTYAFSDQLVDWNNTVNKGDILRVFLQSQTDVQRVVLVLYMARPGLLRESLPQLDEKADIDHTHDERYYERTELETLLANGMLDGRYYTETEIDAFLAALSESHDHDDLYYRQSDVDSMLSGKAGLNHSHTASQTVSGTFDAARIPDLSTAKITSGIFDVARIPNIAATKVTSGVLDAARIPQIDAAKIGSGLLNIARIPTGSTGTTVATGNRGIPSSGDARSVLRKTSSVDYATEWASPRAVDPREWINTSLTTINVPDGTSSTSHTQVFTGLSGAYWRVDITAILTGYGDLATNGSATVLIEIERPSGTHFRTVTSAPYLFVQGVTSACVFKSLFGIAPGSDTMTIRLRHTQNSGVYTLRMQQMTIDVTPYFPYG